MQSVILFGPKFPQSLGLKCFSCSVITNSRKGWPRLKLSIPLATLDSDSLMMKSWNNIFLPVSAQVYMLDWSRRRQTTNSLFGQQLKHWFLVTSVTTCDRCDHMWQVWPHVTSVTTCDKCGHSFDLWTSWTFGHHGYLDIMDIWISWIFGYRGYLDIMNIWISWIFVYLYPLTFETLQDAGF